MRAIMFACGIFVCMCLSACEKAAHNMYDQPKQKSESQSNLFSDNTASRTVPDDSIAASSGELAGSSGGVHDEQQAEIDTAMRAQTQPYRITAELLERGRERYGIYCEPCHSPAGDGDGYITRRGFPHPPSYHSTRLREISDRHIFDVISNGYGLMYSYGDRIDATDRWRIVAYVRALQLSQHAVVADLPPDIQDALRKYASAERAQ